MISADEKRISLLAIDDVSIPFTHNLRLEVNRPVKHPDNPVLAPGTGDMPDSYAAQFYGSVIEDEGKFRAWYVAMPREFLDEPDSFKHLRPAYAESEDGIHWTKPELGLVEYKGSKKNNLVLMEDGAFNMINLKVLIDEEEPDPARRYKMTAQTRWATQKENEAGGFQERGWGTLAPFVSADGLTWRLAIDAKPDGGLLPKADMLLPEHHFEAAGGLYKWNGVFYASGQSGGGLGNWNYTHGVRPYSGREVMMHRSADFSHWSKTSHLGFIRHHQHEKFPYGKGEESHEGVSVWNRGNVLIGIYGIWHGGPDWEDIAVDVGLLISNDGLKFREPAHEHTFIERGADGTWDQRALLQGQGFANVGDETRIYYGAWSPGDTTNPKRGGIGMAVLPRDRFGSLKMQNAEGAAELVTAAFSVGPETGISINASGLGTEAWLRIELLDEMEQLIPGFSGKEAIRFGQSGFSESASWGRPLPAGLSLARCRGTFEGNSRHGIALHAIYIDGKGTPDSSSGRKLD
ncbi:MAG: hypothetical protein QF437_07000 [Planctomycetota bacterium]|jgi:hypothetical protein|nr:hypothetical protein [Planctomycetota bacterium]MDP7130217.1 hypothetical protein [Planctomycetota bacterium]